MSLHDAVADDSCSPPDSGGSKNSPTPLLVVFTCWGVVIDGPEIFRKHFSGGKRVPGEPGVSVRLNWQMASTDYFINALGLLRKVFDNIHVVF